MNITWYLLPLAIGVSLVWTATRYEDTQVIVRKATKLFTQILVFMAVILIVLVTLSHNL